jgi:hypothetical protein
VLPRLLLPELRRRLTRYPAVALVGPRQCGKTTLALALGGAYYDLEQQADRLRLDLEWAERTASSACIILDEAQAWPEIFARVRGAIDQNRKRNGRFLLLGSVSPALAAQASSVGTNMSRWIRFRGSRQMLCATVDPSGSIVLIDARVGLWWRIERQNFGKFHGAHRGFRTRQPSVWRHHFTRR